MIYDKTILVTGSSGLIGSAVVRQFGDEFNVVGFDTAGPPFPPKEAECVTADLTREDNIERALERVEHAYGNRIASVIHLAAFYSFSGEESPLYDELTVRGTERLLAALQHRGFHVEQFVFSSTMIVHAPTMPGSPITEDSPIAPKWPYPESKVRAEELIRAKRADIPCVLLRIAGVYDNMCHSIPIAHQIQRIHERRLTSHVFPGDLSHGQSFVHLDDVVSAIAACVHRREQLPRDTTLLIGESDTMSYDELQHRIARLVHAEEWDTRQIPKAVAEAGAWVQDLFGEPFIKPWMIDMADDHYELDISHAEQLLGWKPVHSLRHTLPRMIEALKADPEAWYRENKLEGPATAESDTPSAEPAHAK